MQAKVNVARASQVTQCTIWVGTCLSRPPLNFQHGNLLCCLDRLDSAKYGQTVRPSMTRARIPAVAGPARSRRSSAKKVRMSMTDRASKVSRWRLRPATLLAALITVASLGIAGWYVAKTRKPIGNTEPYRAAHGVVPGRVNELRVKGVLLRFPASYRVEPQTADEIVHGQADSVSLDVDMSHLLPVSENRPAGNRRVWIELGANFYEDPQRNWAQLQAGTGKASTSVQI